MIHPAAHTEGRPSFTALVANVDSDTAKYIADCRVQTSRQEMIDDLKEMAIVGFNSDCLNDIGLEQVCAISI